ncbi:hypothetical protein CFIO01_10970 [Colletotrichum fioriniae PJ7]|uniref:Knr4/Smi1-like domain-containing protein n=1 Tax=Colletotrichum fioriniae PJ7 TaxID=1445577 RepID=A0A010R978_9PEZI|nr:hypothetical protein CFIO01_10970 [Colletotrichum fioriniae PJ7]
MANPGPHRRGHAQNLASKTIAELTGLLNEALLSSTESLTGATYMCPPASSEDIKALQRRVIDENGHCVLDPDYVTFLTVSDGFKLQGPEQEDSAGDLSGILYNAARVIKEEHVDFHLFGANPLLHAPSKDIWTKFDWDSGVGVDLGPAGDEGSLWMFGPAELQLLLGQFDDTYPTLTQDEKKQVDQCVLETHGSMEAMRELRFSVIQFYHWSPKVKLHLGFRAYLEDLATMALAGGDPYDYFLCQDA